jgi:ankyrin repeat protein
MVGVLLKSDVNASILAQDGCTALHRAVRKGHSAIIEMLLAAEAKAKAKSCPRPSRSSFELAAQCGFEDIVRALFDNFKAMQEPPHPHQLDPGILHPWVKFGCRLAAERGHHANTVFLHDALNDIPISDLVSYNGMQILTSTVNNNWPDVVDAVLSKYRRDEGDNLFTNNQLLRSHCKLELITASKLGYTHIMEQVPRCGVPANELIVLRGATLWPLHEATLHGHIGAMRLLLDWGADPNARNSCDETALHLAMCNAPPFVPSIRMIVQREAVRMLVQRGADVHLVDGRGRSPCLRARDMRWGYLDYLFEGCQGRWG